MVPSGLLQVADTTTQMAKLLTLFDPELVTRRNAPFGEIPSPDGAVQLLLAETHEG
jgi:hypothetical protein